MFQLSVTPARKYIWGDEYNMFTIILLLNCQHLYPTFVEGDGAWMKLPVVLWCKFFKPIIKNECKKFHEIMYFLHIHTMTYTRKRTRVQFTLKKITYTSEWTRVSYIYIQVYRQNNRSRYVTTLPHTYQPNKQLIEELTTGWQTVWHCCKIHCCDLYFILVSPVKPTSNEQSLLHKKIPDRKWQKKCDQSCNTVTNISRVSLKCVTVTNISRVSQKCLMFMVMKCRGLSMWMMRAYHNCSNKYICHELRNNNNQITPTTTCQFLSWKTNLYSRYVAVYDVLTYIR